MLHDAIDIITACETILFCKVDKGLSIIAAGSAICTKPYVAGFIFSHTVDDIAGKTILLCKQCERLSIVPVYTSTNGTKPKISFFIFEDREHMKMYQVILQCVIGKDLTIIFHDALPGGKPHIAFTVLHQTACDALWTIRRNRVGRLYKIRVNSFIQVRL